MQKLYCQIYTHVSNEDFLASYYDNILDFDRDDEYLHEMFELTVEKQDAFLGIIKKYAPKFDIDTMEKVSILAIGIAIVEMLWLKEEIPAKVSINEAIELAKYFGDDSTKNIVNGILNSFYENINEHQNKKVEASESFAFFAKN